MGLSLKELIRASNESLNSRLAEAGFERRAAQSYSLDVGDADFVGWLGLQHVARGGSRPHFGIFPGVGVRSASVERLYEELTGQGGPKAPFLATFSKPLGELLRIPRPKTWAFHDRDPDKVAQDLVDTITARGVPWMRRHASLDSLEEAVRNGPLRADPPDKGAIILLLNGHPDEARALVSAAVQRMASREDDAAEYYRRFAEAFDIRATSKGL